MITNGTDILVKVLLCVSVTVTVCECYCYSATVYWCWNFKVTVSTVNKSMGKSPFRYRNYKMSNKEIEMAVCESKCLISTLTDINFTARREECVNMCQYSQQSWWNIMNLHCNIWAIFNVVMIFHLTVMMWGIFLTEHPSKHTLWTVLFIPGHKLPSAPLTRTNTCTHTHTHNFHVIVTKSNKLNANIRKTSSDVRTSVLSSRLHQHCKWCSNNTVTTVSAYHYINQQPLQIQSCFVFTFCSTTKAH
jgi:hypothetical protein